MKIRILILTPAFLALTSCSSVRDTLGLERSAPNEFAVSPSQVELEMPPDYYKLPTPQPGAPRPQETLKGQHTQALLTGSNSTSQTHFHEPSTGMTSFLEQAGVEHNRDSIRNELYQEAELEKHKGGTIAQQLGLKDRQPGEVVKPLEEQDRLQKAGIPTSQYIEVDENADAN